jgi:DNA-binding CsgD family transcriptional regulator
MNAYASLIYTAPAATVHPSLLAARRRAPAPASAPRGAARSASGEADAARALPLFYSDDRRTSPDAGRREQRATAVLAQLLDAPDHAARQAFMKRELRAIGFEWLGYGTVEDRRGSLRALSCLTSYANEAWTRRYFVQRYHQVDTRAHDAPGSGLPLVWDLEALAQSQCRQPMRGEGDRDIAARRRMLLEELEANGIRSGIFFRLATPGQMHEHTFISLESGTPGRRWIRDDVVGRALMLGLCVHEHVSRHVQKSAVAAAAMAPMSATQQSILEALLLGRSDKVIAYALGLSSHAVDYHLRQLRRRFGVRNRVQLVSAAADWQP